jgi:hypothetical protein
VTTTDTPAPAAPSAALVVPDGPHELANMTLFNPDMARELVAYANTVKDGSLLPKDYRNQPANIVIAFQLGLAVGISPTQALYEIHVVNGRPSMSANLMASLVRRSGHKLHVRGDEKSCTGVLTRRDMPDEPFEFTWTIEMAHRAKLTSKDTWRFYPATMLRSRATSEVCKMGAAECLVGITLSTEEARDMVIDGELVDRPAVKPSGLAAVRDAATTASAAPAQTVNEAPADAPQPTKIGLQQRTLIGELWPSADLNDPRSAEGAAFIEGAVGRRSTIPQLTDTEAHALIECLRARVADVQANVAAENVDDVAESEDVATHAE